MRIAYALLSVKRMFLLVYISICNVMSLKRKQVAAKQAFVFLVPLLSEQPVKPAGEHEVRVHDGMSV